MSSDYKSETVKRTKEKPGGFPPGFLKLVSMPFPAVLNLFLAAHEGQQELEHVDKVEIQAERT